VDHLQFAHYEVPLESESISAENSEIFSFFFSLLKTAVKKHRIVPDALEFRTFLFFFKHVSMSSEFLLQNKPKP